jgi:hypothetical protein
VRAATEEDEMSETEPREESEFESSEEIAEGGEGSAAADVSPEIGTEDQEAEQTGHPAPEDDVGVPSDEELSEEGAGEGEDPSAA